MPDTTSLHSTSAPTKKTTEEKIRIAIAFLQRQGYQVISRHSVKHNKFVSNDVERRMKAEREAQISAIQTAATLGSKEVAAIMGVCVATIDIWVKNGNFPQPLPLKGYRRWNAETIQQYMRDRGITTSNTSSS